MREACVKEISTRAAGYSLGYATPSDPLLGFMLYSGAAVFLLTIVLLAAIAVMMIRHGITGMISLIPR